MTLSDFYAIEGLLIGIMGAYFLIQPFLNRRKIYRVSDKDQEEYKHNKKAVTNSVKMTRNFVSEEDLESGITSMDQFGNPFFLYLILNKLQQEVNFTSFDFNLRSKIDTRFEYYVQRDAIKGFVIIFIGICLEITSVLLKN